MIFSLLLVGIALPPSSSRIGSAPATARSAALIKILALSLTKPSSK